MELFMITTTSKYSRYYAVFILMSCKQHQKDNGICERTLYLGALFVLINVTRF